MTLKFLIVEDEAPLRNLLEELLEFEGYSYESADCGAKALELVKKSHFDLILLDCMMPEMDGFEVATRLREMGIESPIIMITAAAEEWRQLTAAQLGINQYVVKPFSLDEILKVIRYFIS